MAVTNSPSNKLKHLLQQVTTDYPDISFSESEKSFWDSKNKTIFYNPTSDHADWSLLHEIGHMVNQDISYKLDVQLLIMESKAWQRAVKIGKKYGTVIEQDYIEDCLDSYRDWLHKRSTCPECKQTGIQDNHGIYNCVNCGDSWKVSISRFCRSYRRKI